MHVRAILHASAVLADLERGRGAPLVGCCRIPINLVESKDEHEFFITHVDESRTLEGLEGVMYPKAMLSAKYSKACAEAFSAGSGE